jgi:hypothetical protein
MDPHRKKYAVPRMTKASDVSPGQTCAGTRSISGALVNLFCGVRLGTVRYSMPLVPSR